MNDMERLAAEYENAAEIVRMRIGERRAELRECAHASRRASVLEAELGVLYREREDALETARHLRSYCGRN